MKNSAFFLFSFLLGSLLFSCRKEAVLTDSSAKLEFSEDTIIYDTVFTSVGSTTKNFKVYNTHNKKIIITSIRLANGSASYYRLNVDGLPGKSFTDVEIAANDSIYIFVEVTLDPNNKTTPLVVTDSVLFETNGNMQDVDLVAWGQDAYFHRPPPGYLIFALPCSDVWKKDKPHVVYGYAVIDSLCTLNIDPGVKVHFHGNSGLIAWNGGTLKVNGILGDSVIFQGDRLESYYQDIPGQWDRIWCLAGSINNTINYAVIKNGNVGVQADTNVNFNPTVRIDNTLITNMAGAAVFGQGAKIVSTNSVYSNCGQYIAALTIGGDYDFRHCTFGNFWSHDERKTPSLLLNNYYEDVNGNIQVRNLNSAFFGNCIIYGDKENEIKFDSKSGGIFNFIFQNSLIKVDGTVNTSTASFVNILKNLDPRFRNVAANNFQLDTLSAVKDKGDPAIGAAIPLDLKGVSRTTDTAPDPGAYERVE